MATYFITKTDDIEFNVRIISSTHQHNAITYYLYRILRADNNASIGFVSIELDHFNAFIFDAELHTKYDSSILQIICNQVEAETGRSVRIRYEIDEAKRSRILTIRHQVTEPLTVIRTG